MQNILCTQEHVVRARELGFILEPAHVDAWVYQFGGPKWWKRMEWIITRHSEEYWIDGMTFGTAIPYWREFEFTTVHFNTREEAVLALYAGMLLHIVDRPFPREFPTDNDPVADARDARFA